MRTQVVRQKPSLPNKKSQFCRELLFHSQGSQNTYSMLCMYSHIKVPEHTSRRGVSRHTWPSQTWSTLGRSQSLGTRQQRPGARWSLKSTAVSYRMLCCSYTILYLIPIIYILIIILVYWYWYFKCTARIITCIKCTSRILTSVVYIASKE